MQWSRLIPWLSGVRMLLAHKTRFTDTNPHLLTWVLSLLLKTRKVNTQSKWTHWSELKPAFLWVPSQPVGDNQHLNHQRHLLCESYLGESGQSEGIHVLAGHLLAVWVRWGWCGVRGRPMAQVSAAVPLLDETILCLRPVVPLLGRLVHLPHLPDAGVLSGLRRSHHLLHVLRVRHPSIHVVSFRVWGRRGVGRDCRRGGGVGFARPAPNYGIEGVIRATDGRGAAAAHLWVCVFSILTSAWGDLRELPVRVGAPAREQEQIHAGRAVLLGRLWRGSIQKDNHYSQVMRPNWGSNIRWHSWALYEWLNIIGQPPVWTNSVLEYILFHMTIFNSCLHSRQFVIQQLHQIHYQYHTMLYTVKFINSVVSCPRFSCRATHYNISTASQRYILFPLQFSLFISCSFVSDLLMDLSFDCLSILW